MNDTEVNKKLERIDNIFDGFLETIAEYGNIPPNFDITNEDMDEVKENIQYTKESIKELFEVDNWIQFDDIEEIEIKGQEILLFDGEDFHIDYVDCESDYGTYFFANGTRATHWKKLEKPDD